MELDPAFQSTRAIGWEEIHHDARALARMLKSKGPFLGIVAVARGGLVPAAVLARELELRHVDTICIASYGDGTRQQMSILKRIEGSGAGWLVVDDLVDTGATARAVRAMLPAAHYATLYAKPAGRRLVDSYVSEMDQDVWLIFPWDAPDRV
ncbi:xanthine phosphoribosyltransferase [Paramagnetospirillum kuznetsovii]|uniref:Xanthine phosphoribosyltransferase n=1 Tax=Paramagnetospirillum kuznetsovii TaxID=2053833 RepID=A0A364NY88_9PROT|nr:xanthine phosphoribosyltransferase [Paramagnetospirillum kuznetsovii]RAU22048.1 xanthine phosphoribosyltransferase [Paramagnetospirillum kuznetsovii]